MKKKFSEIGKEHKEKMRIDFVKSVMISGGVVLGVLIIVATKLNITNEES